MMTGWHRRAGPQANTQGKCCQLQLCTLEELFFSRPQATSQPHPRLISDPVCIHMHLATLYRRQIC